MVSPKVQLHVHLDGAIRHSTAYELLKKKNLSLPGNGSFDDFVDSIVVKKPVELIDFLRGFSIFLPGVVGDLEAIERIAYEFCETQFNDGVIYVEARYCPHLFMPSGEGGSDVTPKTIVGAVNKGFARGEKDFGIIACSILCCVRGKQEWSREILDLCVQFKGRWVVGIDVAGDEASAVPSFEGEEHDRDTIVAFEKAAEMGIHRTVHAGEAGPALIVWKALSEMKAERIGHGYRVLEDKKIYKQCLETNVHFECCPRSSLLTSAVDEKEAEHPVMRFARDGASFSINTDGPIITNTRLSDEYELVTKWGLTTAEIQQANIQAMKNSFAEPAVKEKILNQLYASYGISQTAKRN